MNHLTAARVYRRRLAELGFVTASVGRGTFVRTLAPAGSAELGDDWQLYALPEHELSYSEQVLADAMASGGQPDLISLAVGWPSPALYRPPARAHHRRGVRRGGDAALSYLPAEGLYALREQLAARGRRYGFADDPDEIIVTSGAKQGISLTARATLEPGDVAVVESPTFAGLLDSLRQTGARVIGVPVDEDGFDVGRSRAPAGAPRGQAGRPPDRRAEPHRARHLEAPRAWRSSRWSATSSCSRTACTRTRRSAATRAPPCAASRRGT